MMRFHLGCLSLLTMTLAVAGCGGKSARADQERTEPPASEAPLPGDASPEPVVDGDAPGDPITFEGEDGQTCVCEQVKNETAAAVTLDCFGPAGGACAPTLEPWTERPELRPWVLTRHDGCGRSTFSFSGSSSCTYESSSSRLIGAAVSNDAGVGPCRVGRVGAGAQDTCREGRLCSLSGGDASCTEACSLDALGKLRHASSFGALTEPQPFAEVARLQACDANVDLRLRRGCGALWLELGGTSRRYDASSLEPTGVSYVSTALPTCGGLWGDAGAPCRDEVSCSLCDDAADVCTAAQLRGE